MKILLVGEFSGVHNNLRDGLKSLGHDVMLFAGGDGFKKFPADISWDSSYSGYVGEISKVYKVIRGLQKLKEFDVVQFINPDIFMHRFGFNKYVLKQLMSNNKRSFLLVAGDHSAVWEYWKSNSDKKNIKYSWIDDLIKYDLNGQSPRWLNDSYLEWESEMLHAVNGVIPIMYEYAVPYRSFKNIRSAIPIPINVDKIIYRENKVHNKLVIFHGLNRYGVKGTRYVEQAFNILQKKYPNDLELIIRGKLPYNQYLELINKTNVVIDQTTSYSLGVNGLVSMAMGKLVLGGAEPEGKEELGYKNCPAINITPDVDSIVFAIEKLLETKEKIPEMGFQSRAFVENYHHYRKIAAAYVDVWSK